MSVACAGVAPFTGAWIEIQYYQGAANPQQQVAPFTGAWIEILIRWTITRIGIVAPFTGAWIEIPSSRVKLHVCDVAPFTGAWIEIPSCKCLCGWTAGRSLHGSVD